MKDASISPMPKSLSKALIRPSPLQEHPHSFHEHSYSAPTHCEICDGLLVGLWSQGYNCNHCGMNTHRGQGVGEHNNCRAEALLVPCPGPDHENDMQKEKKAAKLCDAIAQIRELTNNPNFIKEVTMQMDKDIKAVAKNAIMATAVNDERGKNLKRLKTVVVPLVRNMDAITANGDFYVMMILMGIHSLATIVQTFISFGSFMIVLAPRHGFFTQTSFQLAAMHDATVTASLHAVIAIASGILYYLACVFERKNLIIDRFFKDALKIEAEADVGISISDAAERGKYLSTRILISSILSMSLSFYFWHHAQPPMWEAAAMPPIAKIFIPAFVFTVCCAVVAYLSYTNAPAELSDELIVGFTYRIERAAENLSRQRPRALFIDQSE